MDDKATLAAVPTTEMRQPASVRPDASGQPGAQKDESRRLAVALWDAFVPEGPTVLGQKGRWSIRNKKMTYGDYVQLQLKDLVSHVHGHSYLALRPLQEERAWWLGIDVDTTVLAVVEEVSRKLDEVGLPFILNFSGNKGYHFYILFASPLEELRYARFRKQVYDLVGDKADVVTTGKQRLSLPCGVHPGTGKGSGFVDRYTLELLSQEQQIQLLQSGPRADVVECVANSMFVESTEPGAKELKVIERLHPFRECINVLWRDGLQEPDTRHYASLAIIAAVNNSPEIPEPDRLNYVLDWVAPNHVTAEKSGLVESDLKFALEEAERLMHYVGTQYKPTCHNSLFAKGLKSACTPEFAVKCTKRSADMVGKEAPWVVALQHSKIWGKLGWATGAVYSTIASIALDSGNKWDGMPVMQLHQTTLAEDVGVHANTVRESLRKLREVGLIMPVPAGALPERSFGSKKPAKAYAVPEVTEETMAEIVGRVLFRPRPTLLRTTTR